MSASPHAGEKNPWALVPDTQTRLAYTVTVGGLPWRYTIPGRSPLGSTGRRTPPAPPLLLSRQLCRFLDGLWTSCQLYGVGGVDLSHSSLSVMVKGG